MSIYPTEYFDRLDFMASKHLLLFKPILYKNTTSINLCQRRLKKKESRVTLR